MTAVVPLRLQVAGVGLELLLPPSPLAQVLGQVFAPFAGPGPVHCQLAVALEPRPEVPGPRAFPSFEAEPGGAVVARAPDFELRVEPGLAQARLIQGAGRYPVESALKWLLAAHLRAQGGVLIHGVGLAVGGQGTLFVGPSGAGKSTLGNQAQGEGLTRLADELVALVPGPEGLEIHGTPWNLGSPGQARLRLLGLLAHTPDHQLTPVSPSAVLRVLLSNTFLPDPSPQTNRESFRVLIRGLREARTAQLGFALRPGVGEALRAALC